MKTKSGILKPLHVRALSNAGIPIATALARKLGVSHGQVFKMITNEEISLTTTISALEDMAIKPIQLNEN